MYKNPTKWSPFKERLTEPFAIRLNPKTDKALSAFAKRKGMKRSDLIRELLDDFEVAYTLLKQYKIEQKASLDREMTEMLLDRFPDVPPRVFYRLAEAVSRVAEIRETEWELNGKL